MRIPCPDPMTLQEQMTLEVECPSDVSMAEHLRDCSHCRDHLRDLRRVDALLMQPVGQLPDDFEQSFTEGVLDRMVTSQEKRGLLSRRLTLQSTVAICIVTCVLTMYAFRPGQSPKEAPKIATADRVFSSFAEGHNRRISQREALDSSLLAIVVDSDLPSFSSDYLRSLKDQYGRLGLSLDDAIARLLQDDIGDDGRSRLLRTIGVDGERALPHLRRESHRSDLSSVHRELLARAAVRMGTHASFRFVTQQVRRGVSLDRVLAAMADESPSNEQLHFLKGAIRAELQYSPTALASSLQRQRGTEVPSMLWTLLRRHPQSRTAIVARSSRVEMLEMLRHKAFIVRGNHSDRDIAIEMLGQLRDGRSTQELARLLKHTKQWPAAVKALERIGTFDAISIMAAQIDVSSRGKASSSELNAALMRSLKRLGSKAAGFLLRQVQFGKAGDPRQFLLAAGIAGDDRHLPLLGAFLRRDDLKTAVVQAMAFVTSGGAERALKELLHTGDRRVEREARRMLRRLQRSNEAPWRLIVQFIHPGVVPPFPARALGYDASEPVNFIT